MSSTTTAESRKSPRRYRILYIHGTQVPPPSDLKRDRYWCLSERLSGAVIHPIWFQSPKEVEQELGPGSYPTLARGSFTYHWVLTTGKSATDLWRRVNAYLRLGVQLHRSRAFDAIVVYSHMTNGLCATLLKLLTGSKLVVEIATSPAHYYGSSQPNPSFTDLLRFWYSEFTLHVCCLAADRVHLLAPDILETYPLLRKRPKSVFHEFVCFSGVLPRTKPESDYILLVGSPWYLKGADLLIQAFRNLMDDFPGLKLKLLGHYPDRAALDAHIAGCSRVEVLDPLPNPEALRLIAGAAVLALPSRCEGMGRVLVEAMSAAIPVIGSDVGGIPHMVRDGENGFLFPCGDSQALESRLRQLLEDPALARRMGENGREMAAREFTEERYVEHFVKMIEDTVSPVSRR